MAQIIINIKDDGIEQTLNFFIIAEPIPTDLKGNPLYTPSQWVKKFIVRNLKQAIQRGKNIVEMTVIDEDVVT